MMMMVAVMAEILHLFSNYGKGPAMSNPFLAPPSVMAENGAVRRRLQFATFAAAALAVCLWPAASTAGTQSTSASSQAAPKTKPIPPPSARVDINRASIGDLLKVPGITSTWAARIVRFRPYRTKRDLLERGVVPSEVYDRIKDAIIAHRGEQ